MDNCSKKRLAIYLHYDPKGEVRDYVTCCLRGLKEVVSDILVVVNKPLSDKGKLKLESEELAIITRDNRDFDFGAWKAGIEHLTYNYIAEYDELLLTNNSYYGPIYPFSEMWNSMDAIEADFWGINMHPEIEVGVLIPRHIQSYWLVFRNKILKSSEWKTYWDNLPHFDSIDGAIFDGEIKLTHYFEKRGFKSATYMNFDKYNGLIYNNPTIISDVQVIKDRCPIVKRKFFFGYKGTISSASSIVMDFHAKKLMFFLEKNSSECADIIWDDLLKTQYLSIINDHLNLNFILPSSSSQKQETHRRVAVIMYIYVEDLAAYCRSYTDSIPEYFDIVIVNIYEGVQNKCKELFRNVPNKVIYLLELNHSHCSPILVTCRKLIKNYDYICFIHITKFTHSSGAMPSIDLREHCFSSLLYSNKFVRNIILTFEENPRLGLLIPPTAMGGICCHVAHEWSEDYENSKIILREYFGIDENELDPHPMVPFGGMFWARTEALKTLTDYGWEYENFPKEPQGKEDGLVMRSIKRLISRLAQNDGFYTAFVMPDCYASFYMGHLYFMNREMKNRIFKKTMAYADMDLLRYMENLTDDTIDFWVKHRILLEMVYLYYKWLRKIMFGGMRQRYTDNWHHLKNIRRSLKNYGKACG